MRIAPMAYSCSCAIYLLYSSLMPTTYPIWVSGLHPPVCAHVYVHVHMCSCLCPCSSTSFLVHVRMCACAHVCMCACVHACTQPYVYRADFGVFPGMCVEQIFEEIPKSLLLSPPRASAFVAKQPLLARMETLFSEVVAEQKSQQPGLQ